jgi:hypothetical protein
MLIGWTYCTITAATLIEEWRALRIYRGRVAMARLAAQKYGRKVRPWEA